MEKPFVNEVKISSYDTDMNSRISIQNVVKFLMETAIEHSEESGYTIERLMRENRGWVVLNWIIKMYDYPKFRDTIKINTWANSGNTLQATRYFSVEGNDGNIVFDAASRWAFLDLEKRHPVRFSQEMGNAFFCDREAPFDPGRYLMPAEKEECLISEKTLVVRRSETDTNGHTNNTRYIEWAVDDVPDEIYMNYKASEIRVLYRKETRAGDKVTVKTYMEDDNDKKIIVTAITDSDSAVLCKVAAVWEMA